MFKFSKTFKKLSAYIVTAGTILCLTACGNTAGSNTTAQNTASTQSGSASSISGNNASGIGNSHILVAYFSYFDNTDSDKINSKRYADSLCSASVTMVDGRRKGNNDVIADYIKQRDYEKKSVNSNFYDI